MQAISADGAVHEFPDGTDPAVIDRVMKTYAMQSQTAPQPDAPMPGRVTPAPDQALRDVPAPQEPTGLLRKIAIGAQGIGRGVAETAAMPQDALIRAVNGATTAANTGFGTNIPQMPLVSDQARDGGSKLMSMVGVNPVDPDTMTFPESVGYRVGEFGAQAAMTTPALVRAAAQRAPELVKGSLPQFGDSFLRPYMGESVVRPLVGDAAATAGAGTAVAAVDHSEYKDNPIVQTLAGLTGAVGGMTIPQTVERGGRALLSAVGRPFGASIDNTIPVDPKTFMPVPKAVSDRAATMVQDEAVDAPSALTRMVANRNELKALTPDAPMPSPAALSEDTGLATLERRVNLQNQGEAAARNRDFNSSVRDTVDRIAPPGSDPSALVNRVQTVADERVNQAQRGVDKAEGQARGVQIAREGETQTLAPHAGRQSAASQQLDQNIVDNGYVVERARKNAMFENAPGAQEQIPAQPVFAAVDDVLARNNNLRPDAQLPQDFIARLNELRPNMVDGVNEGGPGTALGQNLADTRKFLATAYERAQRAGNFDMADSLGRLRQAINDTIETAPGYTEANQNYRSFADAYRPSPNDPAAKFTRAIDRDPGRGSTPPSETAGRFLQPQAPEKQAALRRMIDESANPEAGQRSAFDYLMSDLESSGVARNGVIDPAKLRGWQDKWGDLEQTVPGIGNAIRGMTRTAARGEERAAAATGQVREAQQNLKRTQSEIDKGAFGKVLEADPDKAVAAVMSQPHSSGRQLGELIRVTEGNDAARNGLKAAVRDFIIDKATTNASQNLAAGDRRGPVSLDKLSRVFNEHERELAQIFNPEEMNTLRAGHRALDLAAKAERTRVSSGSDTAEKTSLVDRVLGSGLGKGLEAALRLKYGMLKAGGVIATARRLTAGVTGGPSNDDVLRLVERAAVDPELMGALLGRKIPVASPAWNSKMQRLLAVSEGARTASDDEE